jgi:pSer/pThr/pTyr-binding forkhead associated (FHA) protein
MAGESNPKSSSRPATPPATASATRAFPVLVPQEALAGQPDIPLSRPVTTVGSNENARLHLVSRTVSKGHAIFVNSGAGTYVADLASRTGVLVNGKLVKDADLQYGDRVQIGKFVFRFKSISKTPQPPAPPAPSAAVIVVGWPALPVNTRVVQIGRRETSDISLSDDAAVSAAHAVIFQMNGKWYIRDVGSRTGTHVNGKAIHQEPLNFGDRIVIGSSTILFQPGAAIDEMSLDPEVEETPAAVESADPLAMDEDLQSEPVAAAMEPVAVPLAIDEPIPLEEETAEPAAEPPGSPLAQESEAAPLELAPEPEPLAGIAEEAPPTPPEEFAFAEPLPVNEIEVTSPTADEPVLDLAPQAVEPTIKDETLTPLDEKEAPAPLEDATRELESVAEIEPPAIIAEHEEAPDTRASTEPSGSVAGLPVGETPPIPPEEFAVAEPPPLNEIEDAPAAIETPKIELDPDAIEPVFEVEQTAIIAEQEKAPDTCAGTEPGGSAAGLPVDEIPPIPPEDFAVAEPPPLNEIEEAFSLAEEPALAIEPDDAEPVVEPAQSSVVDEIEAKSTPAPADIIPPIALDEQTHEEPAAEPPGSVLAHDVEIPPLTTVAAEADSPLDDFVFVPAAETAAAPELPEVLFWGDPEPEVEADPTAELSAALPLGAEEPAPVEFEEPFVFANEPSPAIEHAPSPVEPFSLPTDVTGLELASAITGTAAATIAAAAPTHAEVMPAIGDVASHAVSASVGGATQDHPPEAPGQLPAAALEPTHSVESDAVDSSDPELSLPDLEDPAERLGISTIDELPAVESSTPTETAQPGEVDLEDPAEWSGIITVDELPADAKTTLSEPAPAEPVQAFDELEELEPLEPEPEAELPEPMDSVDLSDFKTIEEVPATDDTRHVESVPVEPPFEGDNAGSDALEPAAPARVEPDGEVEWAGVSTLDELPGDTGATQTAPTAEPENDDLQFLDFTDAPAEPVAEVPPVVAEFPQQPAPLPVEELQTPPPNAPQAPVPLPPSPSEAPAAKGKPTGPSLFGFDFEGGSFLGGMPLPLNAPANASPNALSSGAGKGPIAPSAFNALATPVTGLGAMASGIAGSGAVSLPAPAPRLNRRPAQPPIPPPAKTFTKPASLSGLVSEAKTPWAEAPVIPTTRRAAGAKQRPAKASQPMSSTFSVPGAATRNAEVFSQMAAPIGVEVFGGKPGNPAQFNVPDARAAAAKLAVGEGEPSSSQAATPAPVSYQIPRPARRSRLPYLIVLLVTSPILIWQIAWHLMPVSSQMVGSIQFAGVNEEKFPFETSRFVATQKQRLFSDDVREMAAKSLRDGHKPPGFLDDSGQYMTTVDEKHISWDPHTTSLQLVYNTSDPKLGAARVAAILQALRQKDQDLEDALASARTDVDAAQSKISSLKEQGDKLMADHEALASKAEDRPSDAAVAQEDQDKDTLKQKWTDAKATLAGNQEALSKLENQDPSKPLDIERDPQVVDLENQLRPLVDGIRARKNAGSVTAGPGPGRGTDLSVNATTRPAPADDPLVAELQRQADVLQKKLDDRKSMLMTMQSIDPVERATMHARQVKDLATQIAVLRKAEQDAHTAYDAAVARSAADHQKVSAAKVVDAQMQDMMQQYEKIAGDRKLANDDLTTKEATLAACIHLNGEPTVTPPVVTTDLRPGTFAIGTTIALVLVGLMIVGELRRPKPIGGFEPPAAAPLVAPQVRLIPWPQPRDLQGLQQPPKVDVEEIMA